MRIQVGDGIRQVRWVQAPAAQTVTTVLGALVGRKVRLTIGRAKKVFAGELVTIKAKTLWVSGCKVGIRFTDLAGATLEVLG